MRNPHKNISPKSNITFLLFAFNEEKRIEIIIKNFLPYGEVYVIDNFSSDKTEYITKRAGAKVIKYKNEGWVETKKESDFVFKHVKTEWVYWGFADEMLPITCLEEYKKIANNQQYKVVVQKKKTMLYNKFHEYMPVYATIKLFRKHAIDFTNNRIHQMGKFATHVKPSEIYFMPPIDEYSVYHFSGQNAKVMVDTFNKYTSIHAQPGPRRQIALRIFIEPIIFFIIIYILQGAFRFGIEGLIVAVQYSYYVFLVHAKTYEKSTDNDETDKIEKEFFKLKKSLLTKSPHSNFIRRSFGALQKAGIAYLYRKKKFK